ncbi:uncharacterized protein RJT21DRAFT_124278 [Scheffersomyces amazonensis]|uniref:uncharacterized protein n=1 Tax=Scheffersomyces amazonensis TaxID=1078765 RepID=UPI00315D88F8
MAQGGSKLKSKGGPGRITKKQSNPKKAAPKIIKAKKSVAKSSQKLSKVHQSQVMSSTEKLIASRVGHLEIIKGSRRQIEKEEKLKKNATNTSTNNSRSSTTTTVTTPQIVDIPYQGEAVSCIPELIALDPDLVIQQEKKSRKSRARIE